jgi:hypothetical protein
MSKFPRFLWVPLLVGTIFNGLFVAMWIAFAVGKMDVGGVVFITALEVFALPLLVGVILCIRGNKSGLAFLKFGSVLFITQPFDFWRFWCLEYDPEWRAHVASKQSRS